MRITTLLSLLGIILFFSACRSDDEGDNTNPLDLELEAALNEASGGNGLAHFVLPASNDFANIPQDPLNEITAAKVELGKLLYHETGLAIAPLADIGKGTYSCASCHHAAAGFQAGRFQGISEGGMGFAGNGANRINSPDYDPADLDVQPLRSPSTLNVAYQSVQLWNGQFGATGLNTGTEYAWTPDSPKEVNHLGFEGTEIQAIAGLEVHRMGMDSVLRDHPKYKTMFAEVYGDIPEEDRYTHTTIGLAIAAYERTLLPNQAPFQRWLAGEENAMTDQQKLGAILFFDKAKCGNCHNGPALNNMNFHALGMSDLDNCPEEIFGTIPDDPANRGRGSFTENEEDDFKFKTPQLYNLKDSPFYGHGSSFRSVRSVVEYKNQGVAENPKVPADKLDPEFQPLNLTSTEIDDITAFINDGLHDPNLTRYLPESLPSGNCFPVNDPQSRIDLGCD